ncbi:hypothetical protein [Filifactor alocis]|uniref:hypothetical protein n=1 Tax=Filifactor alocis TaxID=143361 RepID=UPI003FA09F04
MDKDKLQLFQNKVLSYIMQKLQDVDCRLWELEKFSYTHFSDIFVMLDVGFPITINVKIADTHVYIETKVSEDFREPTTSEQIIINFEKNTITLEKEFNTVIDIINNIFDQVKTYQNKK